MKKILIAIIILVVILIAGRNLILREVIQNLTKKVTGLPLSIKNLDLGIFQSQFKVEELSLYNPAGYADPVMINIPVVYVDYDLGNLVSGKIHLEDARFELQEFIVVKNKKGELNINALRSIQSTKKSPEEKKKEKAKLPEIKIDRLKLKIGKVIYKDYSLGETPSVREFNINIDEEYSNITDPYALMNLIVTKALMNTTIGALANFDVNGLRNTVEGTLIGAKGLVGSTLKQTEKTATEAVKGIKNILQSPFRTKENKPATP